MNNFRFSVLMSIGILLQHSWVNRIYSQELVPDPGFEVFNCENYPQLEHWLSPNEATPDVITTEGCGVLLNTDLYDLGYAVPYSGNRYAGIFCCYPVDSDNQTREYLTTELVSALEAGEQYLVSFWIHRLPAFDLAIDRIGIYFSDAIPSAPGYLPLSVEPQLETSGSILQADSLWQFIQFEYIAGGFESFLTIGCFRWPDEMAVWETGTSPDNAENAYYFLDQVSIQHANSVEPLFDEGIKIEVVHGGVRIVNPNGKKLNCSMFDEAGRLFLTRDVSGLIEVIEFYPVSGKPLVCRITFEGRSLTRVFVVR